MHRTLIWIFFFTLFCGELSAEHIIGGEMSYVCIGPNSYSFTMKLYRDCASNGAQFDNPAIFAVFDASGFLVEQIEVPLTTSTFIDADLDSPCLSVPPNICVQEGTYTFTANLPSNDQAYQIVYQRCCRNQTIQNLTNPGAQGLTITATIPEASIAECNSSPEFSNFPPPVLCAQESLVFDHSAVDPDGDSLAYSLCSPFIGASQANPLPIPPSNPPYDQVMWGAGYSAVNPIDSDPPFAIDPLTGEITGTPTQLGQYVIGVCVEEWRNGQLVSTSTRDFQFNVALCEETSEALVAEIDEAEFCQDLTFTFDNESDPGNTFFWDFGDPNTEEDNSDSYNGTYTYPDTGLYVVTLITNPGFFCSETTTFEVPVYFDISIEIESYSFECVNGEPIFDFTAGGNFNPAISEVSWNFGPNALTASAEGLTAEDIAFTNYDEQSIAVEVVNNICSGSSVLTFDIPDPPVIDINPQEDFCSGLSQIFTAEVENASEFAWDFGVEGSNSDVSDQLNANFTYPEPGIYTVTLTASDNNNCPATDSEVVDVQPLLAPEIPSFPIACLEDNSFDFVAQGAYTDEAVFSWSFEDAEPSSANSSSVSDVVFLNPGEKEVTLTVSENGCTEIVAETVLIHPNPQAEFLANPLVGCAPLNVSLANQSVTESQQVSYFWDLGDGSSATSSSVLHQYENPGQYTVSLQISNQDGCIDTDLETKDQLITVLPSPEASFVIEPPTLSVIDPQVTITSTSEDVSNCEFYFDETLFSSCSFTHELENAVPQTVILTVTNEFGCVDRAEGEIRVSDHLVYIPNAFTPDGDGLNDFFRPELTGVTRIEMWIYDRWGKEVFYTDNPRGWNGSSQADYYAQAGVYTYKIILTDFDGWNFEYIGSVSLIR